ncbi:DUF6879 family protein [Actinoallomurus soli]|uniref:DUF6879 family protein n=1 Tax=Actinoallomurus soli TaxID=2952535 RepID=UPI0020927341|nr:DUF6879 family protein [Actinoallomurus soli]MCO5968934.1 hypothetical protein [Actinoallomurus soli]
MLERIPELPGIELELDDYFADFGSRLWQVDATWKLERRQSFREPDVPSWVAWAEGDRERSLALAEEMRAGIAELQRRLDAQGIVQRRVRIVDLPVTDYLAWELNVLRIRAELGERIRVLSSSALAVLEASGRPVPEVIMLGEHIAYQVHYDAGGVVTGAKLVTAPRVTAACLPEVAGLWEQGEDLGAFLARTNVLSSARS